MKKAKDYNFMTTKEVANKVGLSEWTIRQYAREEKIISYKFGKKRMFNEEDVVLFIEENIVGL